MNFEVWDLATGLAFLITFGVVLAAFVPLLISIQKTWNATEEPGESEGEY